MIILGVALSAGVAAAASLYLNANSVNIVINNRGRETIMPVTFLGKRTDLNLNDRSTHTLIINCR